EGVATREEIHNFALHLTSATESFVRSLHAILSICPDPLVRHSLISNVLEEEGMTGYVPGQGATFDPERHHPTMARRFARAAGVTDAEVDDFPVGPPRWFHRAIAAGNWLGPFAYIAVGTEANIPPTYRLLVPAFARHYGFSDVDMEFLYEHMTVDDRHGEEGAQLIASVATTEEARRQSLEGARRGGNGWWQILLKHAGSVPVPA
ncbi:MAG TPA: iron-containing redox enzyme family protein, partial [Thermoanaerobaculia bacterium]|nr:iron-containing redox enzyme family protein [Thermoanaerobaculia bacterium]